MADTTINTDIYTNPYESSIFNIAAPDPTTGITVPESADTSTIDRIEDPIKELAAISMPETLTSPFEDGPALDSTTDAHPDIETPDIETDLDLETQAHTTTTTTVTATTISTPCIATGPSTKGSSPMDGKISRDRYDCNNDGESDSVRSMLEMMESKKHRNSNSNSNSNNNSNKAKGYPTKWLYQSPPSLLGGETNDDVSYDCQSFDCIALSTLEKRKEMKGINYGKDEDDEESMHPKPPSFRSAGSDKSNGTTTTTTTGRGSNAEAQSSDWHHNHRRQRLQRKYIILLGSFVALLLLLGILVLSFSLYVLRQGEADDVSVLTRKFWREDLPNTLAFWTKDDDSGSVGVGADFP